MPELSIIVPVYKVEKYLSKCIDSILAQTFRDFELILIDDGSPDNCGAICDDYAARDARIKVIHQPNAGVSAARNAGLDVATGTYLGFVDSDDWIEPIMYEALITAAKKHNADIAVCGINHFDEDGKYTFNELLSEDTFNRVQLCASIYEMPNRLGGCIWNKIARREVIQEVRYRCGIAMAEDRLFLCDYFRLCNGAVKIPEALYCVTDRSDSATHTQSVKVPYELLTSSFLLKKLAGQDSRDLECLATDKFLDDCTRYLPQIKSIGRMSGQRYVKKLIHGSWLMAWTIFAAYFGKMLPKTKIHRYSYEFIKVLVRRS